MWFGVVRSKGVTKAYLLGRPSRRRNTVRRRQNAKRKSRTQTQGTTQEYSGPLLPPLVPPLSLSLLLSQVARSLLDASPLIARNTR